MVGEKEETNLSGSLSVRWETWGGANGEMVTFRPDEAQCSQPAAPRINRLDPPSAASSVSLLAGYLASSEHTSHVGQRAFKRVVFLSAETWKVTGRFPGVLAAYSAKAADPPNSDESGGERRLVRLPRCDNKHFFFLNRRLGFGCFREVSAVSGRFPGVWAAYTVPQPLPIVMNSEMSSFFRVRCGKRTLRRARLATRGELGEGDRADGGSAELTALLAAGKVGRRFGVQQPRFSRLAG